LIRYIANRLLWLIPTILLVSFIVFGLIELTPGTIIDGMLSDGMTAEDIAALERLYNLDRPMIYRYGLYMLNMLQGDLGVSQITGLNVWSTYISRLPNTLLLALSALIIAVITSIPLGIFTARRAGTLADTAGTMLALVGVSMPAFWLGLLLLLVFSAYLGWLPGGGFVHGFRSLILPAITSATLLLATAMRQTRSSMLEVLRSDFLRTARAKGVPEKAVIRKHALGNAMIPIIATLGTGLGIQLAGSVVIEQVFAWPGIGRLTIDAVMNRDVTMAMGCIILTCVMYTLVQLIADLLFAVFDPRIRAMYSANKKRASKRPKMPKQAVNRPVEPAIGVFVESASGVPAEPLPVAKDMNAACATSETESSTAEVAVSQHVVDYSKPDEVAFAQPEREAQIPETSEPMDSLRVAGARKKYKKRSTMGEIAHRIKQNKSAIAGVIILGVMVLTFIATLFISYDAVIEPNIMNSHSQPTLQNPFGTDRMGRDLFLRVIYGTRYSLAIGFGGIAITAFFGILLGATAGYFGGKTDNIIMRLSDVLASIPGLLLGMVIMIVLGPSLRNLIIAVGVGFIPITTRITRASILTVKDNEFVEAARSVGLSNFRIIFTQVLPNGLSPIIVSLTTALGMAIIIGASLSFLGFGIPLPTPEWGALVSAGRTYLRAAPWLMTFPGLFIMVTVLGFNLLGDGLRDALDPKLKK
jgi:ABC-type dipeptide/oligopeptide/nickel transport system permease component